MRHQLAQLATHALAREEVTTKDPSHAERVAAIAVLTRAMEADARHRRWRRNASLLTFAVAASLAAVFVARNRWHAPPSRVITAEAPPVAVDVTRESGRVLVRRDGLERALEDGSQSLAERDRVITSDESIALLRLATGTTLTLGEGGDLTVVSRSSEQRFVLGNGHLRADVAKLAPGRRFIVSTSDAEVEVRGTSFAVSVVPSRPSCGAGSRTHVVVFEGIVTVRSGASEAFVRAGEEWPRGCVPAPVNATQASVSAPRPRPATSVRGTGGADTTAPPAVTDGGAPSRLALENALYAEAMSARHRGDAVAAVAAYDRFIARYADSALAENCAAERMRLLAAQDRAAGVEAARRYLVLYPNGFARDEAAALESSPR